MICSELEASQKRCTVDPTKYLCMGKACMAWKITTESKDQQFDAPPPRGGRVEDGVQQRLWGRNYAP